MKPELSRLLESTAYALVFLLALAALWLVLNAPAEFLNNHPVYQGF